MTGECVHEMFERQAERTPHARAVAAGDGSLTYAELNRRANRLAHHLRDLGVRPESLVGLCGDRSPETLVALLGILKAGGAYLPLDPAHPPERLAALLDDAAPEVVVTYGRAAARLPRHAARTLDLTASSAALLDHPEHNPRSGVRPHNLAYCIYTSGSTGAPKGVAVAGASLANQVCHMASALRILRGDRVLQFTPLAVDAALEEIFPAWIRGATVVLRPERVPAPEAFAELLAARDVSVVSLPSSYWHHWVDALERAPGARPPALRLVFVGGERVLADGLRRWRALPWTGEVEWLADYGPTEATISCATYGGAVEEGWDSVPVGRPIANTRMHLLDAALRPVAPGATGEIHVAGAALARGYRNRPALTAERFVPDPFGDGGRMYRTGDVGRALPGGDLQFVGRADHQIKVLGHRIEPGEVEAALLRCEGVREAVVVAREETPGEPRLVAYVGAPVLDEPALRARLAERLPPVMIPSTFVRLDRLPVSPASGKVERARLPAPRAIRRAAPAGADAVESAVWTAFGARAGRAPETLDEGFWASGGDSLRAARLLGGLGAATGVALSFAEFWTTPTVRAVAAALRNGWSGTEAELAARVRAGAHAPPPRLVRGPEGRRRASHGQQRLWFLARLQDGAATYSVPFGYRVRGRLSLDALDVALTGVVARHPALRTALVEADGVLWQEVAPPMRVAARRCVADGPDAALAMAEAEAAVPFDLGAAPLLRATAIRIGPADHLLVLNVHHAVFDAWSLGILWRDLGALYRGASPPQPRFAYADYVEWQGRWLGGAEAERQRSFWRDRLQGELPVLRLDPAAAPAPRRSQRGGTQPLHVEPGLEAALRATAARQGTTPYAVLLAAYLAALYRHTRQEQVVVGVPVACRSLPETEDIVGYFTNTVAVRAHLSPALTFGALVEQTTRDLAEATTHEEIPFDAVVDALALPRLADGNPIFQTLFVLQTTPLDGGPRLDGVSVEEVGVHSGTAKVDLTCTLRMTDRGIEGELEYAAEVMEPAAAARWADAFVALLEDGLRRPGARLDALAMLGPAESAAAAAAANGGFERYADLEPVHAAFERQARLNPGAVAIEAGPEAVTYGELEARANRLARDLVRAGAGVEARVGVHLERSVEMVVALLAVLKSGAAFVPLDTALPLERIRAIARSAALRVVVTRERHVAAVAELGVPLVVEAAGAAPGAAPRTGVELDHLAYVYYTSGSTGKPKGVAIEHRCAASRLAWLHRRYSLSPGDRVVHKTPLAFDVAVWEIFGPLAAGATILMADAGAESDVEHIHALLSRPRVVFVHFVPSMLDAFLRYAPDGAYPDLRWVQLSGEPVTARLGEAFRARFSAELHNLYGQTETSEVAGWECGPRAGASGVPIGRPLGIYRLYLLDDALRPVPAGVPGELCVAGLGGLARGYLGQPAATAERFVPHPYPVTPGERLYRTGDLAIAGGDGVLAYLGRVDGQTKIRGCRVEPGEVEAVLAAHPAVEACAVVARSDAEGRDELVAYVVGGAGAAELARQVERFLPRYMHPSVYVDLTALPLTSSGKLDRLRLPAPSMAHRQARGGGEGARSPLEVELAALWREVLRVERVGRGDNFFAIGGNSMKSILVLNRVNAAFGVQISARQFFGAPTLEGLAATIEAALVAMVATLSDDEAERRLDKIAG